MALLLGALIGLVLTVIGLFLPAFDFSFGFSQVDAPSLMAKSTNLSVWIVIGAICTGFAFLNRESKSLGIVSAFNLVLIGILFLVPAIPGDATTDSAKLGTGLTTVIIGLAICIVVSLGTIMSQKEM